MTARDFDARGATFIDVAPGVQLMVMLSGREIRPPTLDVGNLPGVRVYFARAWRGGPVEVTAACVHAPSSVWFQGAEQLVFERANQLVQKTIGNATSLVTRAVTSENDQFIATFTGDAGAPFDGVHLLGFDTASKEAVLCTVVCKSFDTADCGVRADRATLLGSNLGPPPPPGPVIATAFTAASHPLASAAFGAALAIAIVALVLWKRPRPSPWPKR